MVVVFMLLIGSWMKFLLIGINASFLKATSDFQYNYHSILHRHIAVTMPVTHDLPFLVSILLVKCLNLLICNNNSNFILEDFHRAIIYSGPMS